MTRALVCALLLLGCFAAPDIAPSYETTPPAAGAGAEAQYTMYTCWCYITWRGGGVLVESGGYKNNVCETTAYRAEREFCGDSSPDMTCLCECETEGVVCVPDP